MGDTGSPRPGGKPDRSADPTGDAIGGDAERGAAADGWADDEYDTYTAAYDDDYDARDDDYDAGDDELAEDHYDDDYDDASYVDAEPVPVAAVRREPPRDRHDASRARGLVVPAFLAGLLVGLLVLGLAWMGTALMGDDGDRVATTVAARTGQAEQTGDRTDQQGEQQDDQQGEEAGDGTGPGSERLQRCARAEDHLEAPLRAAEPAMGQWEVHIGAMNKLVTGAISLQQANAFWNQTRVGAHQKLARLDDAVRTLQRQGVDCPRPDYVPRGWALHSCAQRVAADERALGVATAAAETWRMHVRHMDMLRQGRLSPAEATRMWLASWQSGMRQLRAYRAAESALAASGSCPDPS